MEEYFRTALSKGTATAPPERDHEHLSATSRLLEKQREVNETEALLDNQKEEFKLKMEVLKQRREHLNAKEHELRESLINFEKYINELDSKRMRALKRAQDERDLTAAKQKEIEKLQEDIEQLTRKRQDLLGRTAQYAKHSLYLEKTVEVADEFQEIQELVDRHTTLTTNKASLLELQNQREEQIEAVRKKREVFLEEKNNENLILNNRIGELQRQLEQAEIASRRAENDWNVIQATTSENSLQIGNLVLAVRNLHQMVVRHQKTDKDERPGVGGNSIRRVRQQLEKVVTFVEDFSEITEEMKRADPGKPRMQ